MGYVLGFDEIDRSQVGAVGGKGAQLGELSRLDEISVPDGFCVTTAAYREVVTGAAALEGLLDRLSHLRLHDGEAVREVSAEIRRVIEEVPVPDDLVAAIRASLGRLGGRAAYAVRSSATAEDLPGASFAGQQDSYLNVVGLPAVLEHVSRCWASLFTERAVIYRLRNGFDDRSVQMAVVVQEMAPADAAGVLFTADPVTSNRTIATVEAVFGLGEALVSGLVNADAYTVRGDEVVSRSVATKQQAVQVSPDGGTRVGEIGAARQQQPVLTDAQIVRLTRLGRRIEAHFGLPQDIEWCLVDDDFQIVQSRPITTVYPIPEAGDQDFHVYLSVGHQQMMTDPMKPLGLSFWQMTTPAPMAESGGRLFVDVTQRLTSATNRAGLLEAMGRSDPLMADGLLTVLERDDIRSLPDVEPPGPLPHSAPAPVETDPTLVTELIRRSESSIAASERDIKGLSGEALLEFILTDLQELKRNLFDPLGHQVFMSAMEAAWWLNDQLQAWLGEKNAADTLTQSVPHNVTSEMGLALLDVADVVRGHPEVVAFLEHVEDEDFLTELAGLPGGQEARQAIESWLERYGMRCVGEIDITRPRWSERPSTLVPVILGHVRNFAPGAGVRRFEEGRQQAEAKEQEVLERLRALPDGQQKAEEVKQKIDRVRTFIGYREYPKYGMVCRYFVYKRALLAEAERLVQAHVLRQAEDIFYLRFDELREVVRTGEVDQQLIERRKGAFSSYEALTPPRVLTSDGEALNGAYRRDDLPAGALVGLPVSAGTVEGRARVVFDMAQADLEPGDILVTPFTDPSWTPLFVAIAGLVTEVGGLMTHGAVIAREYGLPAVVGVQRATRLIQDGQRIRLHGTDGYVELLSP